MITWIVLLSPRSIYFNCESKSFNSITEGDSIEGTNGFTFQFERFKD